MNLKRRGLGLLPPLLRLAIVFSCSTLFILINDILGAVLLFTLGLAVFILGENYNWKLGLSAPLTGGMMLLYNVIFSPPMQGGAQWFIFTVNQAGFERGLVTGFRMTGVMFISFAWLFATPIPEMYQGLAWIKFGREWTLGILRGIQILKREFVVLTQLLIIRGLKWNSPLANIKNLVPLVMAIMPRVIENAQKATFASQSHKIIHTSADPSKDGHILVQDLCVRYGKTLPDILRGVDLEISPGKFVYLAGRNKAGKTTLLRAMGGVIPWIMGEVKRSSQVRVFGTNPIETPLPSLCGRIRYVAPDPFASIHGLTVGQEISFLTRSRQEAEKALSVMGIQDLWERETTKLSGGQQVRLVLAGALASGARTLLLDSPMQELDPEGRAAFMEALEVSRKNTACTIMVADPFWQNLLGYMEEVAVLEEGSITAALSPDEFFTPSWLGRCHLEKSVIEIPRYTPGDVAGEMEHVHVALEGNQILKGFDFAIREGELIAVAGPNGSGKTTAMLTLAGAIKAARGRVRTKGSVAYVVQNANLQMLANTVEDELSFGPKLLNWSPDAARDFVREGLSWTGLDPQTCPIDLHESEQRLLAIRASNTNPSVFILDEPTVGLDSQGIKKVMGMVGDLLGLGKGVIIITHDEEIGRLANRTVVVKDGRVVDEKAAQESLAVSVSPFSAPVIRDLEDKNEQANTIRGFATGGR